MHDHFGVAGGLEDRAVLLQTVAHLEGIHQVAVVNDSQRPHRGLDHDRLSVGEHARAGGGIASVPDRPGSWQLGQGDVLLAGRGRRRAAPEVGAVIETVPGATDIYVEQVTGQPVMAIHQNPPLQRLVGNKNQRYL